MNSVREETAEPSSYPANLRPERTKGAHLRYERLKCEGRKPQYLASRSQVESSTNALGNSKLEVHGSLWKWDRESAVSYQPSALSSAVKKIQSLKNY